MKCVIYARVSTKREEQKNSLENQVSLAERMAKEHGFTIVGHYIDNGISGTGFKNRLEINRLLDDAKEKKFDVVIAKSVSRLGRNLSKSLSLADDLEQEGIRLILPEDDYDTETSKSRFMFNLKAILAEEESNKMSERIKLSLREKANKGEYKAPQAPYGYFINPLTKKLEVNEDKAAIVKEIFRLYLFEGWGMFKISNYLMRIGTPSPKNGKKWHQNTIKGMLNNQVYVGKLVHCKEETLNTLAKSELYKKRKLVEPEKQVIIENAHPALIAEEDFQAVQELMRKKGKHKSNGKESLFAHIAQCADCKSGMHFKPDRRNGAYVCGGYVKHTTSYCSSHIIEERLLLNAVKADIKAMIKDTVKVEKLYGIAEKKASSLQSSLTKELKQIDRNVDKFNNQVSSLLTLHADGAMTTEMFKQQSERISIQLQELANRKAHLQTVLATKKDNTEQLQAFKKEVERFSDLDIEDENILKQVLQRLINKVEVFEEGKIKIHYNLSPSFSS
ncbi:recombinase [Alkalihalobacillus alcalophilus ATCC 27647 = CGMCC 1.3604]|uniref:Recombinase n=1 Tax=Alkalihalobacillus alcalophilus ATCC 27647 = CGMCC 1.3604 TaxID=1218173 RepID=A0A094YQT6_ALKAL|nr:recombinase family protein [Alkalihalobacillus alcalophilus]KGA95807.1 recombinase [Alkalihalobacillus alcalophilus ATCC 27647 = CGMCC 1.3604]MED1563699.1 recombinase family protein [Alkalihalobacillus alcalophilus]THG88953.1 recombinase [Alkalihalobacillus alcalophilus ATCC 27647 = CGMCC 1.3604]